MARRESLGRGAVFMVLSALLFAGMGLTVKLASRSLPNPTVVFFRNAFGLVALLPWAAAHLGRRGLGTHNLRAHLVRGLAGTAAMYLYFYAIAHLRLADAVMLNYSLPLFMPVIAWAWLREPIPPGLWRSLLLGFFGIALILKPGLALFQPAALFGLASALLAALAQVGVRRLTASEPTTRIVLYFALISTAVSALALPAGWRAPEPGLWGVLLAMGLLASAAQLFLTRAYAQAPAAQVGPFIYACVPFAALLDGLFLGAWPDPLSGVGAVLVSAAAVVALRLERGAEPGI